MEHSIKAPQIGEAIQAVNIIKYLKSIGDKVAVDEPIVTVETHKASVEVESPIAGTIKELRFPEGTSVPVGETIIVLSSMAGGHKNDFLINNLSAEIQNKDFHVAKPVIQAGKIRNGAKSPREKNKIQPREEALYTDTVLKPLQRELNKTLSESAGQVIQANIQTMCDNGPIQDFRLALRKENHSLIPSRLEIIAWAAVCALKHHPLFCSRLINSEDLRVYKNPNLGIARALPEDGLTTAVVKNVFSYAFESFVQTTRQSLGRACQAGYVPSYHCLALSDLSAYGVTGAIPVVVHPAVATLFIGKPYSTNVGSEWFQLSLSFDHRIVNGAGAAAFLKDICRQLNQPQRFSKAVTL